MSEQYQKGIFVINYLEKLGVHPINIAEAVSDNNYEKSYQLIKNNPQISKERFLKELELKEEQN